MSLASDIITAAYRESNLVPIVSTPSTAENTEGLRLLNNLILSTIGSEAGQELRDLNIGGEFDQSDFTSNGVPDNARLILNLAAAKTLELDPQPYEGQRIAVADAGNNLTTHNLTLDGNGRRIEAAATLVLATSGMSRQWMYRADTANWVRLTGLIAADEMPFPQDFDDYFIVSLALRLNPRHGRQLAQESIAALDRQRGQIRARYRKPRPRQDGILGLMGQQGGGAEASGVGRFQ